MKSRPQTIIYPGAGLLSTLFEFALTSLLAAKADLGKVDLTHAYWLGKRLFLSLTHVSLKCSVYNTSSKLLNTNKTLAVKYKEK